MIEIANYKLIREIKAEPGSSLYEAINQTTREKCALRVLEANSLTRREIDQIQGEFPILRDVQDVGLIPFRNLMETEGRLILELEYFEGRTLEKILELKSEISPKTVLEYALQLAGAIQQIHQKDCIHQNINPRNILVNSSGVLKLRDLGSVFFLDSRRDGDELTKGLRYYSPEQTGRLSQSVDSRSDLYSLGVILFEMAAGRPLFPESETLELIHAHIARRPPTLSDIRKDIPFGLQVVIEKLLQKSRNERYQTAEGLRQDLKELQALMKKGRDSRGFIPGKREALLDFLATDRLYGRAKELKELSDACTRAAAGEAGFRIITGPPGSGKTALAEALLPSVLELQGEFAVGRYERGTQAVPLNGLVQALTILIRRLLTENEDGLKKKKQEFLEKLGENAGLVSNVIPELELIIGPSSPPPPLGPVETLNRFKLIFHELLDLFLGKRGPLIIFLDNLQWADEASLKWLKDFTLKKSSRKILLIGACRDAPDDPAGQETLRRIREWTGVKGELKPGALGPEHLEALLEDSFSLDKNTRRVLAQRILEISSGYPFAVQEYLRALNQGEALRFVSEIGWVYLPEAAARIRPPGSFPEQSSQVFANISEVGREIMEFAACLGESFSLELLSTFSERSTGELFLELNRLRVGRLVFRSGNEWSFSHGGWQEAAYESIEEERRSELHFRLGKIFLRDYSPRRLNERLYYVLRQLNGAKTRFTKPEEILNLARLNYQAGVKARNSSANKVALNYLQKGRSILEEHPDLKESQSDLYFNILHEYCKSTFFTGTDQEPRKLLIQLQNAASDREKKAKAYLLALRLFVYRAEYFEAVHWGLQGLKLYGVHLPPLPGNLRLGWHLLTAKMLWRKNPTQGLGEHKLSTDEVNITRQRLLNELTMAAYHTSKNLTGLIILKIVKLTLKHGWTPYSAQAFGNLGYIMGMIPGRINQAQEISRFALEFARTNGEPGIYSRLVMLFAFHFNSRINHLENSLPLFKEAYQDARNHGDLLTANYALSNIVYFKILKGDNIMEIGTEMEKHEDFIALSQNKPIMAIYKVFRQYLAAQQGRTKSKVSFTNEDINENDLQDECNKIENIFPAAYFSGFKLQLLYLHGHYEEALQIGEQNVLIYKEAQSSPVIPEHEFYLALTLLALPRKTLSIRSKIRKIRSHFKYYKEIGPANFAHRRLILEAEYFRSINKKWKATQLFTAAVQAARQTSFTHDRALACELASRFFSGEGFKDIGWNYLKEAHKSYLSRGHQTKARQLEQSSPDLALTTADASLLPSGNGAPDAGTNEILRSTVDVAAFLKTSRAISGEILLDNLISKMLGIAIEYAGAEKGYLLLRRKGELFIAAEADMNSIAVMEPVALWESENLSRGIVQYVSRTGRSVVLHDPAAGDLFHADPYIRHNQPRSVLCLPIIHHKALKGILYLENNLTDSAFTVERLEVLNLMATQAAVSLENAALYADLESRVRERTRELRLTLDEVQQLKNNQDADYFLTSLLIKPLSPNSVHSQFLTVSSIVKQKKEFSYQKWDEEIGGDICVAHSLTLQGREFVVFLNADAMGKSMQGAGGVLVLGAVFQSQIQRILNEPDVAAQSPQDWLQNLLHELHQVFESFNGAMLMTLVLGLIEEKTGKLYYNNAEHPWSVLYRGGKADFLESGPLMYKLGARGFNQEIELLESQLQPGDILIAGSDGRDDIIIAQSLEGPVYNQDSSAFLRTVEAAGGELDGIMKRLDSQGTLSDDLSLLRVEYLGAGNT